jgi:hypothetical protein
MARSAAWRVEIADHMAKPLTPIKTANKPTDEARASLLLVQIARAVSQTQPRTGRRSDREGVLVFMVAGSNVFCGFSSFHSRA